MNLPSREPDAVSILNDLGAVWSPDFNAYASGRLDVSQVRCALCHKAPCACTYCPATYENRFHMITGRPESEPCGMRVDSETGECPRGHRADGSES